MTDRIDFVCARPDHQGFEPNDSVTMHEDRWAYCPSGTDERHQWQPTGGMALEDLKRFTARHPIKPLDRSHKPSA
jgi:hypothetical protein